MQNIILLLYGMSVAILTSNCFENFSKDLELPNSCLVQLTKNKHIFSLVNVVFVYLHIVLPLVLPNIFTLQVYTGEFGRLIKQSYSQLCPAYYHFGTFLELLQG
jgi:hypothetical protein